MAGLLGARTEDYTALLEMKGGVRSDLAECEYLYAIFANREDASPVSCSEVARGGFMPYLTLDRKASKAVHLSSEPPRPPVLLLRLR